MNRKPLLLALTSGILSALAIAALIRASSPHIMRAGAVQQSTPQSAFDQYAQGSY